MARTLETRYWSTVMPKPPWPRWHDTQDNSDPVMRRYQMMSNRVLKLPHLATWLTPLPSTEPVDKTS